MWGPGVFLGLCGAVCSLAYAQPTGPACGWTKEEEEGLTRPYRILYYLVKLYKALLDSVAVAVADTFRIRPYKALIKNIRNYLKIVENIQKVTLPDQSI